MDESEFKDTHAQVNEQPCVFTKAVLRRCAGCSRAQRVFIAEREVVACKSPGAKQQCLQVLMTLRAKALFALRMTHLNEVLPHGKEIKVECGGLLGLRTALEGPGNEEQPVADIHGLLSAALAAHGGVENLPYGEMVKTITHFQARNRKPRGRS